MKDLLLLDLPTFGIFATLIIISALVFWRFRRNQPRTLESVLESIAYKQLKQLVIPKLDEGEIQIDYLVLTTEGFLVIEVKDVYGAVFGGDKVDSWTVINHENRFTFRNPQPALTERVDAVRQIVRQVPVAGRIVFLDGADFTKGIPNLVTNLDNLQVDFSDPDKDAAKAKIKAFIPYWEQIEAGQIYSE